ncbi:MAG: DUF4301 family protein [Deferribacteres bacterium]|nr:DUF4301 family protein [Deferribacteres bacterium]
MLTDSDKKQLVQHGLTVNQVLQQIDQFKSGIEHLHIIRPCTTNDGIAKIHQSEHVHLLSLFEQAQAKGRVQKFVPASGAATRMFKTLLEFLHDSSFTIEKIHDHREAEQAFLFFRNIENYAFYDELKKRFVSNSTEGFQTEDGIKDLLSLMLQPDGLNLANLPKLLIPFHHYGEEVRSPLWEHLVEAQFYTRSDAGIAKLHFTISVQHEALFQEQLAEILKHFTPETQFDVSYSFQKPSTDTVAVDINFEPFRMQNGTLVFRPGGHGALIENINDLRADILFIKNVDNILPDPQKQDEIFYKKILGGFLVKLESEIFAILNDLYRDPNNEKYIANGLNFLQNKLHITVPLDIKKQAAEIRTNHIFTLLNKPIRVCGMVRNQGDPGGGPFWVEDKNSNITKQIVEQVQINTGDPMQKSLLKNATHFNPVDIVCSVRDFRGQPFDLLEFVDRKAGFISHKSIEGRELLALELPGLWNGAMAFWTTFFVEMPFTTFNPVKTIFDLIRPEHVVQQEKINSEKG